MLVAVICRDKPGALKTRMDNRADHLAYIERTGVVAQAGPFLDESGAMCGSLVILSVESIEEARRWADNDPYARAGLFASVSIEHWNRVIH